MEEEQIAELLAASSDDEAVLSVVVPDRIFGFHAQQAVEKLLKTLIVAHGHSYAFTHNIETLRSSAEAASGHLPPTPFALTDLTENASAFRYSAPRELPDADRANIRKSVRILREHVNARIDALR